MLAYVFWHRPARGDGYEQRMVAFHAALRADPPRGFLDSATYAVDGLAWVEGAGYEDWYLVEDWAALGVLNDAAVSGSRRGAHDAAAQASAWGSGAVFRLISGIPELNATAATWSAEPIDGPERWQRQLVLGPAPDFCTHGPAGDVALRRL